MDQNAPANNHRWFVGHSESEARSKAAAALHVSAAGLHLSQDEDVLDTWFSSGLFPFSVFGWPNDTDDMKAFFPTRYPLSLTAEEMMTMCSVMIMGGEGDGGKALPHHHHPSERLAFLIIITLT